MDYEDVIRMALPCTCPHCGKGIIVDIHQPHPLVDIMTPDELPEDIKNAIIESKNDNPKEPEAA